MSAVSGRQIAVSVLVSCEKGAWCDEALRRTLQQEQPPRVEAALATQLCYGVLQTRMRLDAHLTAFSKRPLERLDPAVRAILRTAAYQMLFLDRIPAWSAVDEAVKLTKQLSRRPTDPGFVNGVLRSLERAMPLQPPTDRDPIQQLSLQYSHPRWLTETFVSLLGMGEAEQLLAADNRQPPVCAMANPLRIDAPSLLQRLAEAGIDGTPHPWCPDCVMLPNIGSLEQLDLFREGAFWVQDPAARMAVTALGLQPGMSVLDACAAPGGKSFAAAADMHNAGEIIACDIHAKKLPKIQSGADRLGMDCIHATVQNGSKCREDWKDHFDAVLVDAPCSGLGVIRKKPDIRYKDPAPLEDLPRVQRGILDNCASYVKPGGVLVYATCTVLPRENDAVVDGFLADHPQFCLEPFSLPGLGQQPGRITFWPHRQGTDGFYTARMRRER